MTQLYLGQIPEGVLMELQTRFDVESVNLDAPLDKLTKTYRLRYHHPLGNGYEQSYIVRVNRVKDAVSIRRIETSGLIKAKIPL